jgi:CubicO group peptidase (beta-lactamase class C family)
VDEYLREGIFAPLGMDRTELKRSPAHGAFGSAADLGRFARELLRPTLVEPPLLAEAVSVQFPGLAGVHPGLGRQNPMDWGLGFDLRSTKEPSWMGETAGPASFGHFGGSGTFLWVDPTRGIACAVVTTREFGDWAKEAWPRLSDTVLEELA